MHFSSYIKHFYIFIANNYYSAPALIKYLWLGIAFFILFTFVTTFFLILRIITRKIREKYLADLADKYDRLITEIIIDSVDNKLSLKHLIQTKLSGIKINNKLHTQYILKSISKLYANVYGEYRGQILKVYRILKLKNTSIKKLKWYNSWHIKVAGMHELTLMKIKESEFYIKEALKSKNKLIRKEARISWVFLKKFEGLDYLVKSGEELSEWEHIRLLKAVKYIPNNEVPNLKLFLESNTDSIVIFGLKLAVTFMKIENKNEIIALLKHKNHKVRRYAIQTIRELLITEPKKEIIDSFYNEKASVQLQIIQMLAVLGDSDDIEFLKKVVNFKNYDLSFQALRSLNRIIDNKDEFINQTVDIEKSNPGMVAHILSEKIDFVWNI